MLIYSTFYVEVCHPAGELVDFEHVALIVLELGNLVLGLLAAPAVFAKGLDKCLLDVRYGPDRTT